MNENENDTQTKLPFGEEQEKALEEKLTKNKVTPDMCRLAFYTMLNGAMQYREMYFRDDIQRFKDSPPPSADNIRTKEVRSLTQKTVNKRHRENNEAFEKRMLYFNKRAYQEIEGTVNAMSPKAKVSFENTTIFMVSCVEELLAAKNQHEALALLKMYNAGELDMLFELTRPKITINEEIPKQDPDSPSVPEENL